MALFWLIYAFRSETRKVGQHRGNLNPSTSKEVGDSFLLPSVRTGHLRIYHIGSVKLSELHPTNLVILPE